MIAFLIAWAVIGAVFFAGFVLEVLDVKNKPWGWVASRHALILFFVILLLWPWDLDGATRRYRRG